MPSQGRRTRAGGRGPNIIVCMGVVTLCWISVLVFLYRDDPSYTLAGRSRATELSHAADRLAQQQDIRVQLAEAQARLRHAQNELAEAKKLAHESTATADALVQQHKEDDEPAELEVHNIYVPKTCARKSTAGLVLSVYYEAIKLDGSAFDATRREDGKTPFQFILGGGSVIKGFDDGLKQMCAGEKRQLIIPKQLAYGKEALVFEVELVDMNTQDDALLRQCAKYSSEASCKDNDDCQWHNSNGACLVHERWCNMWRKDQPWWWVETSPACESRVPSNIAVDETNGVASQAGDEPKSKASFNGGANADIHADTQVDMETRALTLAPRPKSRVDCQRFTFKFNSYVPPTVACFRDARSRLPKTYSDELNSVLRLAKSLNCERFVNVLLVSNSQICFLDNYVSNVNVLESFPVMVSIAADPGAHVACQNLAKSKAATRAVLLCAKSPTMAKSDIVIGAKDYGTSKFGRVAWQKVPTILTVIGMDMGIMLTDIDMVWFANPAPYLLYSSSIVETQCHQCMPADNLGIIVAFPGTENIIKEWRTMGQTQSNDNDAFRQAMTEAQKRDSKAYMHCMPRYSFGFAIGLGDDKMAPDGQLATDYWPYTKAAFEGSEKKQLTKHFVATDDKVRDMQRMNVWKHALYGPDKCTLKSGLFSCDRC